MTRFGFLNINKPSGITSRRAVDHVQRIVRPAKVGHAGTLDPLASGVLVVGVGHATRLFEYIQQMTKSYRGTFLLGQSSTTEDIEGEVTVLDDPPRPTRDALVAAASRLTGEISQRPPAYSALKVEGRRAYAMARSGQEVELAPRTIHVDRFQIVEYDYPQVVAEIVCSSGTYVRSLGRDLAVLVGTAAVMSALVRTAISPFPIDTAIELDAIDHNSIDRQMLSPLLALQGVMPTQSIAADDLPPLANGQPVTLELPAGCEQVAAVDLLGHLVAILERREGERFWPAKFFPQTG
jgi:tRNA pseudouridine55 synthase